MRSGTSSSEFKESRDTDLCAGSWAWLAFLERRCPRTGSYIHSNANILVSDATALGNFRTRLETRTKESNMYASHWDLINLKA